MEETTIDLKRKICTAGRTAVIELIKIAESEIIMEGAEWKQNEEGEMVIAGFKAGDADLPADKLTRAAQAKKIAIMDAFDIIERVEKEELIIAQMQGDEPPTDNFAETRAKRRV
jgi:hypothetical protein